MVPYVKVLKSPSNNVSSQFILNQNEEHEIQSIFVPNGGFFLTGVKQEILIQNPVKG